MERFEQGEGEEEEERANGSIVLEGVMLALGGRGREDINCPTSAAPVRCSKDLSCRPGRLKLEWKHKLRHCLASFPMISRCAGRQWRKPVSDRTQH